MEPVLYHKIDKIFNPKSIAVIGASSRRGQFSNTSVRRLARWSRKEHVYPINPSLEELYGLKCYKSIGEIGEKLDLAYICVGAAQVPAALEECIEAGVESCLIHSSGFSEAGEEGRRLEKEITRLAGASGVRFLGPNCLGIYNHRTGMLVDNADPKGGTAIVSSSGALTVLITKRGMERGIHFSKTASCGNQSDLSAIDLIEYLGEDPETTCIMIYMEGVGDGRRFLQVLRKVTPVKPVLIWKGGRTSAGSRAAASHSAALAGDTQIFEAAVRQSGAVLCSDLDELIDAGLAFQYMALPRGKNVAVVTGPGGPGVAAADACDDFLLACPPIGKASKDCLLEFIPDFASAANPVDLTTVSAAEPQLFSKTMDVLVKDSQLHMFLLISSEAQNLVDVILENKNKWEGKPFAVNILNLMASPQECAAVSKGLTEKGVAVFSSPRQAIKAFSHLSEYAVYLQKTADIEAECGETGEPDLRPVEEAGKIVAQAKADGRIMLTEQQSMELFAAYGIPVIPHGLAGTYEEGLQIAEKIGYPLAVKVSSPDIVHKTDVGGVCLNVRDAQELKSAFAQVTGRPLEFVPDARIEGVHLESMAKTQFELSAGMVRDPQFGPIVMFGLGGILIEALRDVTMRTAPLSKGEALEMIGSIRASSLLEGVRGMAPVDKEQLAQIVLGLAAMALDHREISEVDINPLAVTEQGVWAVDARIKIGE